MKKFFSGLALLTVVILLASCQDELFDWGHKLKLSENEIAFRVGKNTTTTRAEVSRTVVAPSRIYEMVPEQKGGEQFCLVDVVTSLDEEVFNTFDGAVTRGTPIYTENFAQVTGYNGFVGTAFAQKSGTAAYATADIWGGQAKYRAEFAPVTGETLTYSHNYDGAEYNLAWPDNGKLWFFLEAPSPEAGKENAGVSNMTYYPDGHMEFDYTSPNHTETTQSTVVVDGETQTVTNTEIVYGPKEQKDLLFTSKLMDKGTKDTDNRILFYHALTAIRFKVGKPSSHAVHVNINKVTLVDHISGGHCVIKPNYVTGTNTSKEEENEDGETEIGGNPSNANTPANDASKSAACVKWTYGDGEPELNNFVIDFSFLDKDVNGVQQLQNYTDGNGNVVTNNKVYDFPESFYAKGAGVGGNGNNQSWYATQSTADGNFNNAAYEYTFFMVPQNIGQNGVTMEIEYTYVYKADGQNHAVDQEEHTNKAHVEISDPNAAWKAGELHTYYLTSEGVYISVKDQMTDGDTKKSSLEVTNTGTFAQYQRCLMYANWVYLDTDVTPNNHLVVASETLPQPGETLTDEQKAKRGYFTGFLGTNWALGSDGFYYYRYPINVGNTPKYPLFDEYTGPTQTPFNHTHLEFDISAQAVRYSYHRYGDNNAVINDGTYVDEYNRQFVINQWNLSNVTIVAANPTATGTIADWMGLTVNESNPTLDPQPETFSN